MSDFSVYKVPLHQRLAGLHTMPEVPLGFTSSDVLAHILSYVPLAARMRDCACVNSTWHTAAVQASDNIVVKGLSTPQAAGLAAWLQKYSTAAQVSALDLQASNFDDSTSTAVGHVLPSLEHLQSLHLAGDWRAGAVAQLSSLQKLQELQLRASVCISLPAVAQLPQLRTCIISFDSIAAQGQGPTQLSALSVMTCLQHLDLSEWLAPTPDGELPVLDASDCAALTASTQLTFLSLHKWQLRAEWLCAAVFPPERQLPLLQELHLGPCFLHTPAATARLVSAAPNLAVLKVECSDETTFYCEEHFQEKVMHRVSLDGLQQLHRLKCVKLEGVRVYDTGIWKVLALMTQLTELSITRVSIRCLPGILQLTTLTNLRSLDVDVCFSQEDEGHCESGCYLSQSNVPVFLQLPAAVVKCAAELFSEATKYNVDAAMHMLLEAAQAVCPAALDLFWSSEQKWQGVQDSSDELRLTLLDRVQTLQPAVQQMEKFSVLLLELVNVKLESVLAAGCNPSLPSQQQGLEVQPDLGELPLAVARGDSSNLVIEWFVRQMEDNARLFGELDLIWRTYMSESVEGLSIPFVREGKHLLAAVQDLKAQTKRMCDQRKKILKAASLAEVH